MCAQKRLQRQQRCCPGPQWGHREGKKSQFLCIGTPVSLSDGHVLCSVVLYLFQQSAWVAGDGRDKAEDDDYFKKVLHRCANHARMAVPGRSTPWDGCPGKVRSPGWLSQEGPSLGWLSREGPFPGMAVPGRSIPWMAVPGRSVPRDGCPRKVHPLDGCPRKVHPLGWLSQESGPCMKEFRYKSNSPPPPIYTEGSGCHIMDGCWQLLPPVYQV